MHFSRTKVKDEHGEDKVLVLCHGTLVPGHIIDFSAAFCIATIADGGGGGAGSKGFCVKNATLMEVE
jgi:hypothetical protein